MQATFLVTIQVDALDPGSLLTDSELMQDALEDAGMNVIECKPWARHDEPATPSYPTALQMMQLAAPQQ